jgi:hypothetical protein
MRQLVAGILKAGAVSLAALAAIVCLILLGVVFAKLVLWLTGVIDVQHVLGIDTQQSKNYDLASGEGPMMVTVLGFSGMFVTWWRHVNCEVRGCPFPGHRHPGHGRPICRRHYHHDVTPPAPETT